MKKLLVLAFILMIPHIASADFEDDYAPDNWRFFTDISGGYGSLTTTTMYVRGFDNAANFIDTGYTITVPAAGEISFDWSYISPDAPGFDHSYYSVNGIRTILADNADAPASGTVTFPVMAGAGLEIGVYSYDGEGYPGELTVTNFVFSPGCTADTDGDAHLDCEDNCPLVYNPDQADCDGDGVGNSCSGQPDCNGNEVPDSCDINTGTSADCNGNGIPDECDIATGNSVDENGDGVPDECQPPLIIDSVAEGEKLSAGKLSGSYVHTHNNDQTVEIVTEQQSGGKPSRRYSYLNHAWFFEVPPADQLTFHLNGYHYNPAGDGDQFIFAYSTDGVNYNNMFTLLKNFDDNQYTTYELPAGISGRVYIRITDTDHTPGNQALDSVFVDHMFIRGITPQF